MRIPEWLLLTDNAALVMYIAGTFIFAVWAVIFICYYVCESRSPRHLMVALACWLICLNNAILATRNFHAWISITDAIAMSRLAIALLIFSAWVGLIGHLHARWRIRNE